MNQNNVRKIQNDPCARNACLPQHKMDWDDAIQTAADCKLEDFSNTDLSKG